MSTYLRELRRRAGLSQAVLALRAGTQPARVSAAENGRYVWSSAELERIAAVLGVEADPAVLLLRLEEEGS